MSASGLVAGTEGNVSARTPEGNVLITPSGLDYADTEPEDVVVVSLDGETARRSLRTIRRDTHAHGYLPLAARDTRYSAHPRPLLDDPSLPQLGDTPVHYLLAVLSDEGRVPVARYATFGTEKLAGSAAEAIGRAHRTCVLRNHGTMAVGATVSEAYSRTELLEQLAEIYYRARTAGEPVVLTADKMAEVAAKIHDYGQSKPLAVRDS